MSGSPSLTQRAFAEQVKASKTTITRMVGKGQLPLDRDGHIKMPEGLHAFLELRAVRPAKASAGASAASALSEAREPEGIALELRRRALSVQLQELRIGRESGGLVRRADVRAQAEQVFGAVRAAFTAIPDRLSLQIEALIAASGDAEVRSRQIRAVLASELDEVLRALSEASAAPATNVTDARDAAVAAGGAA